MNKQREVIYGQRREILGDGTEALLLDWAEEVLEDMIAGREEALQETGADGDSFATQFQAAFGELPKSGWDGPGNTAAMLEALKEQVQGLYRAKRDALRRLMTETHGAEPSADQVDAVFRDFQRHVTLNFLDAQWKDHLLSMDHLREGIGLVGYAQKKPIDEYKRQAFEMFSDLMGRIAKESVATFFRATFSSDAPRPVERKPPAKLQYSGGEEAPGKGAKQSKSIPNWGKKKQKRKGA
jgi:preprotein translocase subunit SecA